MVIFVYFLIVYDEVACRLQTQISFPFSFWEYFGLNMWFRLNKLLTCGLSASEKGLNKRYGFTGFRGVRFSKERKSFGCLFIYER